MSLKVYLLKKLLRCKNLIFLNLLISLVILGALHTKISGDYMAESKSESRSRYWVFTWNTEDELDLDGFHWELNERLQYIIYQLEKGESGNRHYQGYIEFNERLRFSTVKVLLPGAHFQVRRGTQDQAIAYASKEDTRVDGPWTRGKPTRSEQGKRTDLALLVEDVLKDMSVLDVIRKDPRRIKYISHIKALQSELPLRHRPDIRFAWLYGPSGAGKTKSAYDAILLGDDPNDWYLYDDAENEWWQGYGGQSTVLIDDHEGKMQPSRFLRLLDRYPYRVQVKGSSRRLAATRIIITSFQRFSDYSSYELRRPELQRRFRDYGIEAYVDEKGYADVTRGDPLEPRASRKRVDVKDLPQILHEWLCNGKFDVNK